MPPALETLWRLGLKELRSVRYDGVLILLIVYSFTYAVYMPAKNAPTGVKDAAIAVVDEDHSALSRRICSAFLPPYFQPPRALELPDIEPAFNQSRFIFVVDLPPRLEADVLRGRTPTVQVLVDATAMTQAGLGAGYIEQIVNREVRTFLHLPDPAELAPVRLVTRAKFNPNLDAAPFSAVMQLVNNVTLLALFLAGAALIREREHGTIEHLLAMPVTPNQIMLSKIWASGAVILVCAAASLFLVVEGALGLSVAGSVPLFFAGVALYAGSLMALGIFLGTVGRTMPQFSLIALPCFIIMNLLSGGQTPLESMPLLLQRLMQLSPSTHFVAIAQALLYRGAGFGLVWREYAAMTAIGVAFFAASSWRFRRTLVA